MKARTGAWCDEIEVKTNKGRSFDKGGDGGGENEIDMSDAKRPCVIAIGAGLGDQLHHIKAFYLDLNKYPKTKKTFAKKPKEKKKKKKENCSHSSFESFFSSLSLSDFLPSDDEHQE